jgi:hypothetical protein
MVDVPVDVEGGRRIAILRPISTISTTALITAARNISRTASVTKFKEAPGRLHTSWAVPGQLVFGDATSGTYVFPCSRFEISLIAFWARTLLPALSNGGGMTAMPNSPGDTAGFRLF